jgi:hypothetical protein
MQQNSPNQLPYDPAIPLLGLYPKEIKPEHRKIAGLPGLLCAALFAIAKM